MSTRRLLACVFLFAAGVAVGLVARRGRAPGPAHCETIAKGSRLVVRYPTDERLPKLGGGTTPAVKQAELQVYRTNADPVSDPPTDRAVWMISLGDVTYFAAAP